MQFQPTQLGNPQNDIGSFASQAGRFITCSSNRHYSIIVYSPALDQSTRVTGLPKWGCLATLTSSHSPFNTNYAATQTSEMQTASHLSVGRVHLNELVHAGAGEHPSHNVCCADTLRPFYLQKRQGQLKTSLWQPRVAQPSIMEGFESVSLQKGGQPLH